ncbi:MAG: hypothetical protein AMXMBFR66_03420 [Pseudomonadota bacterium]|nr:FHA domain-containing protein [Rubrivivax sp.]NLZ40093.1 FHA domain-containing protein [Comamonadaceae bacterium]
MNVGPLALVEWIERDGRVRRALPVTAWPLTIGRAIDNDLVLDDPHVAAYHARLELDEAGTPHLLALPSVNGVQLGRTRLAAGGRAGLRAGDEGFTLGTTRLRLRLAGERLAPERPLARAPRPARTLLLAALLWGWVLAGFALQFDPGSRLTDWLVPLLGLPAALAGWCTLWGLASKLFQHRFDFRPHLAVAVRGLLAIELVGFALPWAAALGGPAALSHLAPTAAAACGAAMLLAHARLVAPQQRRALAVVGWSAFAAGALVLLALNQQRQDRWFSELYVSALPPPQLLGWVRPVPIDAFVRGAAALRAPLDAAVRDAAAARDDEGD